MFSGMLFHNLAPLISINLSDCLEVCLGTESWGLARRLYGLSTCSLNTIGDTVIRFMDLYTNNKQFSLKISEVFKSLSCLNNRLVSVRLPLFIISLISLRCVEDKICKCEVCADDQAVQQ